MNKLHLNLKKKRKTRKIDYSTAQHLFSDQPMSRARKCLQSCNTQDSQLWSTERKSDDKTKIPAEKSDPEDDENNSIRLSQVSYQSYSGTEDSEKLDVEPNGCTPQEVSPIEKTEQMNEVQPKVSTIDLETFSWMSLDGQRLTQMKDEHLKQADDDASLTIGITFTMPKAATRSEIAAEGAPEYIYCSTCSEHVLLCDYDDHVKDGHPELSLSEILVRCNDCRNFMPKTVFAQHVERKHCNKFNPNLFGINSREYFFECCECRETHPLKSLESHSKEMHYRTGSSNAIVKNLLIKCAECSNIMPWDAFHRHLDRQHYSAKVSGKVYLDRYTDDELNRLIESGRVYVKNGKIITRESRPKFGKKKTNATQTQRWT